MHSPACVSPTIFLRNPIRSLVCTNYREHNKEYAAAIKTNYREQLYINIMTNSSPRIPNPRSAIVVSQYTLLLNY